MFWSAATQGAVWPCIAFLQQRSVLAGGFKQRANSVVFIRWPLMNDWLNEWMNKWIILYWSLARNLLQAAIFPGGNMENPREGREKKKSLCCLVAGTIVNEVFHHNVPAVPFSGYKKSQRSKFAVFDSFKIKDAFIIIWFPPKKLFVTFIMKFESRVFRHCSREKNTFLFFSFLLCSVSQCGRVSVAVIRSSAAVWCLLKKGAGCWARRLPVVS